MKCLNFSGIRKGGFTLLEVVLAVGIAIGIFLVGIYFYNQAANLRVELMKEADRVSTCRMLMEKISSDLRSARRHDWYGFTGTSNSIEFVKSDAVRFPLNTNSAFIPSTDLKKIRYDLAGNLDGTNAVVLGLNRSETLLLEFSTVSSSTNSSILLTNSAMAPLPEPLTDAVRFLHFRFWDETKWVETWDHIAPPKAVEISMGSDPLTEDLALETYPFEIFRRVILIPTGESAPVVTDSTGTTEPIGEAVL